MPQLRRAVLVTPPRRVVAERVKSAWRDYSPPRAVYALEVQPRYGESQEEIDLTTPGGRGELLTLAVLEAARVHPRVAAETFLELRRRGLSGATLARAPVTAEREIRRVLDERYRALADRKQKAAAIITNARRLHENFDGDPKTIFTRSGGGAGTRSYGNLGVLHRSGTGPIGSAANSAGMGSGRGPSPKLTWWWTGMSGQRCGVWGLLIKRRDP